MKSAHQHKFRKVAMSLVCMCGEIRHIDCAHRWTVNKVFDIQFEKMGGVITQEKKMQTCNICGAIAHINVTAGTTTINR